MGKKSDMEKNSDGNCLVGNVLVGKVGVGIGRLPQINTSLGSGNLTRRAVMKSRSPVTSTTVNGGVATLSDCMRVQLSEHAAFSYALYVPCLRIHIIRVSVSF